MKIFSPALSRLARFRYWHIEHWVNNPIAAQREVLQDLITHGQYTQFGRKYQFANIFNIRTFKQTVPIHEYHDMKPYIDQVMDGEDSVLWNTPVKWFAKSSGTTSEKSKFIPLTEETGLIIPIGQWVMEAACKQIKSWENDPMTRDLQIAVNVSACQFHDPNFVYQVSEMLTRHQIKTSQLKKRDRLDDTKAAKILSDDFHSALYTLIDQRFLYF